jgi:hypothetical protein
MRTVLPLWFVLWSAQRVLDLALHSGIGIDVRIYRNAAAVALAGGDPWTSSVLGFRFAAPPPSILAYVPLTFVPEPVAIVIAFAVLGLAGVAAIRTLRIPLWWLLFPPVIDSIVVGNLDVVVLAALVVGGRWAAIAPVLKIYGAVPLLLQGRWRPLVGAALLCLPSLLWVSSFLDHRDELLGILVSQSGGGNSTWATAWLVPVAIALIVLRGRGSSWLTVPMLWPGTQIHYAALALPAVVGNVFLAAAFAVPFPGPAAAAVVAYALWVFGRQLVARRAGVGPDALPSVTARRSSELSESE